MHWSELFEHSEDDVSGADTLENELEHLELVIPAMLLKIRKDAGLTQAELARRMGCNEPHVSKIEQRSSGLPQIRTLVRYLSAAGARLMIGARHGGQVHDVSFKSLKDLKAETGRSRDDMMRVSLVTTVPARSPSAGDDQDWSALPVERNGCAA